jgi:hypothetical protein
VALKCHRRLIILPHPPENNNYHGDKKSPHENQMTVMGLNLVDERLVVGGEQKTICQP